MIRSIDSRLVILAIAAAGLCGCTESELRIAPNFGSAVTQDEAAQVADPEPHYVGIPAPGSNGARVALAQHRYETGKVIEPTSVAASPIYGGSGNGQGGGGGSTSSDMAPSF